MGPMWDWLRGDVFDEVFKNDNKVLPPLARWHIIYQTHDKYTDMRFVNQCVIVGYSPYPPSFLFFFISSLVTRVRNIVQDGTCIKF